MPWNWIVINNSSWKQIRLTRNKSSWNITRTQDLIIDEWCSFPEVRSKPIVHLKGEWTACHRIERHITDEHSSVTVHWYTPSELQYILSICHRIENSTIDVLFSRKEYLFNYLTTPVKLVVMHHDLEDLIEIAQLLLSLLWRNRFLCEFM